MKRNNDNRIITFHVHINTKEDWIIYNEVINWLNAQK